MCIYACACVLKTIVVIIIIIVIIIISIIIIIIVAKYKPATTTILSRILPLRVLNNLFAHCAISKPKSVYPSLD